MSSNRRIACWMSEKKSKKISWDELSEECKKNGFELFKLDLDTPLAAQEPFCLILHKFTDIIVAAMYRDKQSFNRLNEISEYAKRNPSLVLLDPIGNVQNILDRYTCYNTIASTNLESYGVFTPTFCQLPLINDDSDISEIRKQVSDANITFPIISKHVLGHGSKDAHQMSIIFNEQNLVDCRLPCVVQSFIPHNAILFKLFIVGDRNFCVKRPSLKNYRPSHRDTIYFDSSDVSKADSCSLLSVLDPEDEFTTEIEPDNKVLNIIAATLRSAFGMDLLGVDIVIENATGKYGIIDVNAFPGYDAFPNFYEAIVELICKKIE